jgi:hypothetical protein
LLACHSRAALAGEDDHLEKQINVALAVLNAASIIFLLQINVGIIPLFQSGFSRDRAEKINMLVADLSQGVLVSTFFLLACKDTRKDKSQESQGPYLAEALLYCAQNGNFNSLSDSEIWFGSYRHHEDTKRPAIFNHRIGWRTNEFPLSDYRQRRKGDSLWHWSKYRYSTL